MYAGVQVCESVGRGLMCNTGLTLVSVLHGLSVHAVSQIFFPSFFSRAISNDQLTGQLRSVILNAKISYKKAGKFWIDPSGFLFFSTMHFDLSSQNSPILNISYSENPTEYTLCIDLLIRFIYDPQYQCSKIVKVQNSIKSQNYQK